MQKLLDKIVEQWNALVALLEDFSLYILNKLMIWTIDFLMWIGELAFDLLSTLINGLSLDSQLNSYATQLHPSFGYVFDALNIATYLQIIVSAYITRLVLKATLPFYK